MNDHRGTSADATPAALDGASRTVEAGFNVSETTLGGVLDGLGEAGQALPAFRTIDGVNVAIVAAADYRALVAAAGQTAFAGVSALRSGLKPRGPRKGLSTIERDGEVADFLRDRFRTRATLDQLQAACLERFGAERTPSAGRIAVFRQRATR